MLDRNEVELNRPYRRKMPFDARIIGWWLFATAFISFLFGFGLLSGLWHIPSGYDQTVIFSMVSLTSDLSSGIYSILGGLLCLVAAYGIIRGYKFGWWLMLICSIINISDSTLIFSHHPVTSIIGICIGLGIIIWLVYRRRLYNISRNSERRERVEEQGV